MPYKIFRQGEPPSQRDLQMLMDQGVIVASSTQRPFAPHEGMLIYEIDTHGYMWYNGTTWVALGSAIDAWVSGSNLSVPGNLSANGTLTASGAATVASLASTNDITMRGQIVSRVVDGRVGSGTTDTTTNTTTNNFNLIGGNTQNVPVISGRAYRVQGQISMLTGTADTRASLRLWNGSVDGAGRLGGDSNVRVDGTNYRSYQFGWVFEVTTTETISNLNISIAKIDAGGATVTARVDGNFFVIVEELGGSGVITGF
jgi:hypothetical protein